MAFILITLNVLVYILHMVTVNRHYKLNWYVVPNILTSTDSVTITVTVAVDVSYASNNDAQSFLWNK